MIERRHRLTDAPVRRRRSDLDLEHFPLRATHEQCRHGCPREPLRLRRCGPARGPAGHAAHEARIQHPGGDAAHPLPRSSRRATLDEQGLCPECSELLAYARKRLAGCPYAPRSRPAQLPDPLLRPRQREAVRVVMRYAGRACCGATRAGAGPPAGRRPKAGTPKPRAAQAGERRPTTPRRPAGLNRRTNRDLLIAAARARIVAVRGSSATVVRCPCANSISKLALIRSPGRPGCLTCPRIALAH